MHKLRSCWFEKSKLALFIHSVLVQQTQYNKDPHTLEQKLGERATRNSTAWKLLYARRSCIIYMSPNVRILAASYLQTDVKLTEESVSRNFLLSSRGIAGLMKFYLYMTHCLPAYSEHEIPV